MAPQNRCRHPLQVGLAVIVGKDKRRVGLPDHGQPLFNPSFQFEWIVLLQQLEAERRSRAIISEAEGRAAATLRIAVAERDAVIARAEGHARTHEITTAAGKCYLNTIAEAVEPEEAARILLAQKVLDGFDRITKNPGDKVFLPSSMQGILELSTHPRTAGRSATFPGE